MERDLTTADVAASAPERRDEGLDRDLQTRATAASGADDDRALLDERDTHRFRERWDELQVGFVDEPRQAVEQADGLVAELMQHLARTFSDERSRLEAQWDRGDDVSTEDLRVALQRYRAFFGRLLSA